MKTFEALFGTDFPGLVEQMTHANLSTAHILTQILRQLESQGLISLKPNVSAKLAKRAFRPSTDIQINKNWEFIQLIFEEEKFQLDWATIESLRRGNETAIGSFSYQFFNYLDVLKYSKANKELGIMPAFQSTNFERLQNITEIWECTQVFEKLIFLLSKAIGANILSVSSPGRSLLCQRCHPPQKPNSPPDRRG
jgi:hypothetical protein